MDRFKFTEAETIFSISKLVDYRQQTIDRPLKKKGVSWNDVEVVGFDGASTMAGYLAGVHCTGKV